MLPKKKNKSLPELQRKSIGLSLPKNLTSQTSQVQTQPSNTEMKLRKELEQKTQEMNQKIQELEIAKQEIQSIQIRKSLENESEFRFQLLLILEKIKEGLNSLNRLIYDQNKIASGDESQEEEQEQEQEEDKEEKPMKKEGNEVDEDDDGEGGLSDDDEELDEDI